MHDSVSLVPFTETIKRLKLDEEVVYLNERYRIFFIADCGYTTEGIILSTPNENDYNQAQNEEHPDYDEDNYELLQSAGRAIKEMRVHTERAITDIKENFSKSNICAPNLNF